MRFFFSSAAATTSYTYSDSFSQVIFIFENKNITYHQLLSKQQSITDEHIRQQNVGKLLAFFP